MFGLAPYEYERIESLSDQEIVSAILNRNAEITKLFLYQKCLPLFSSIFSKYYTDCNNVKEFIDEIYVYILTPNKDTGICKLANFGFRCTLTMWLKIVATNFCHQLYAHRINTVDEANDSLSFSEEDYEDIDIASINRSDVRKLICMMPNKRYMMLIEYRYLHEKSNEETAELLEMSMANYYNKHKLAKKQLVGILKKEGLI